jgi:mycothiol system anti-sigma-R factor
MANCQETLNEMYAYLDAELAADRATEIIGHLKVCTDCQSAYEFHAEFKTIIRVKAQNDELSEGFLDRLRECFGDDALNDA